jgi:hypothetical protein
MSHVTKKIKVLEAEYVRDAESIVVIGECSEGKMRAQINKSSFDFGRRSKDEIDYEMEKTAYMMIGKSINMVFDEDLEKKKKSVDFSNC